MDLLLGQCEAPVAEQARKRLEEDESFRRHHDDVAHTLSALHLLPEVEPPEDLLGKTLTRVRPGPRIDMLLAREGSHRRVRPASFSLRELGTIAAVLALTAFVFVPSFRQAGRISTAGQCASHMAQIGTGMESYRSENNGYLPQAGRDQWRWLPSKNEESVSNSQGLFKLILGGHAPPESFQCPGGGSGTPATFAVTAGMTDFPASRFINYSYQHALGGGGVRRTDPSLAGVTETMAILADETPVFRNGKFWASRVSAPTSDNHAGAGQNVLYLDMHVEWTKTASVGVGGNNIYLAEGIYSYRGDETPVSPIDTFLLPAYCDKTCPASGR